MAELEHKQYCRFLDENGFCVDDDANPTCRKCELMMCVPDCPACVRVATAEEIFKALEAKKIEAVDGEVYMVDWKDIEALKAAYEDKV